VTDVKGATGRSGRSLTAGDVPLNAPLPTCGPNDGAVVLELSVALAPALLLARAIPARRLCPSLRAAAAQARDADEQRNE
jgi:hypothetical protein